MVSTGCQTIQFVTLKGGWWKDNIKIGILKSLSWDTSHLEPKGCWNDKCGYSDYNDSRKVRICLGASFCLVSLSTAESAHEIRFCLKSVI